MSLARGPRDRKPIQVHIEAKLPNGKLLVRVPSTTGWLFPLMFQIPPSWIVKGERLPPAEKMLNRKALQDNGDYENLEAEAEQAKQNPKPPETGRIVQGAESRYKAPKMGGRYGKTINLRTGKAE